MRHSLNDEANSQSEPPSSEMGDSQVLMVLKWRFWKRLFRGAEVIGVCTRGRQQYWRALYLCMRSNIQKGLGKKVCERVKGRKGNLYKSKNVSVNSQASGDMGFFALYYIVFLIASVGFLSTINEIFPFTENSKH